jgi:hypothetical protein
LSEYLLTLTGDLDAWRIQRIRIFELIHQVIIKTIIPVIDSSSGSSSRIQTSVTPETITTWSTAFNSYRCGEEEAVEEACSNELSEVVDTGKDV